MGNAVSHAPLSLEPIMSPETPAPGPPPAASTPQVSAYSAFIVESFCSRLGAAVEIMCERASLVVLNDPTAAGALRSTAPASAPHVLWRAGPGAQLLAASGQYRLP